jgi:hypothetical protein
VIGMLVAPDGGAAFAGMTSAIDAIAKAASSGGFGISANGGNALLTAIDDLKHAVESALRDSAMLAQQPALGTTPAANVYKPFLATVASDPVQGAIPALKKLQTDLTSAHAAIKKAMDNFHATEQQNAETLR